MKRILMLVTMVLLLALGAGTALAQSGYDLFQKALVKERAVGDVEEALRLYQRIVKEFSGNHALAAKAQLRMGLLYDRLGRKADAQRAYQVLVNQYADQTNEARQARAKIVVAAPPKNANTSAKTVTGSTAQRMTMIWNDVDESEYTPIGLSADGRYVSFVDGSSGDLAVRDLREGTTRRLTNRGSWAVASSDYAADSLVSPDARQVAYAWELTTGEFRGSYDLRILPLSGEPGEPRIVHRSAETNYISPAGWTLDGKSLLVVRRLRDRTWQIAVVSIADGSLRVLKSLEWRQPRKVSLSPDGRFIAYDAPVGADVSARDIFLLNVDGSRETVAVQNPADDHQPVWSPDGSQILFVSNRTSNDSLWSVHIDGGKPRGPAKLVKTDIGRPLGMTRSGALYYLLGGPKRTSNIYTVDVDANMKVKATPSLATGRFINSNVSPGASPDGQYLAYARQGPSVSQDPIVIVIRSLKTGEEREVRSGLLSVLGPMTWFPDGRSLLVRSRDLPGNRLGFYRVNTTSGRAEVLLYVKGAGQSDLSPDGRSIFYTQSGKLMRFDVESHRETEFPAEGGIGGAISVAVSPDGAQLAFYRSGWLEVMVVGGGEPRKVFRYVTGGPGRTQLAWTPDQRHLLFVTDSDGAGGRDDVQELWRVPVTGGEAEKVGISVKGRLLFAALDPSGQRITYQANEERVSQLWALENFLPTTPTRKTSVSRH